MRTRMFLKIDLLKISFCVGILAFAIFGCSKADDLAYNQNIIVFPPNTSEVQVVHAAGGLSNLDVGFDNNRVGTDSLGYTDRLNYLPVNSGKRVFKVFDAAGSSSPIFSKDIDFAASSHYTVFIVDSASKINAIALKDNTSKIAVGDSVILRFVNMSPDAPALDLYEKGETQPIATNITYKSASQFFTHHAKDNEVFEVRETITSKLLATINQVTLASSKKYTIWCGGYLKDNNNAELSIRLSTFAHNPKFY